MPSKTQLPKKIFENINQRLRSDEDIDLVRLTNQGHQGIAFKVLVDGQSFLIKRTNKIGVFTRRVSEHFIQHEYKIYQRLEGIAGIPKCYGLSDDGSLILEYIDGDSYREKEYILEKKYTYVEDLTNLDTRLKRNKLSYSEEELVAEVGAFLTCVHLGIQSTPKPNNLAYLKHWSNGEINKFKIFSALSDASKSLEYLKEQQTKKEKKVA